MNPSLRIAVTVVICSTICANVVASPTEARSSSEIDDKIAMLIQDIESAKNIGVQFERFRQIESMGEPAIPFIIKHLDNRNKLKFSAISLDNKAVNSFEASRHYEPKLVVDALSAILNQLTALNFGYIYNGAENSVRDSTVAGWRKWCNETYPNVRGGCVKNRP